MMKRLCNSHFGNKGIIFMLDLILAIMIITIILSASYYYIIRSEEDMIPKLQISKTASDIITLIDNQDLLGPSVYEEQIQNKIERLLQNYYGFKLEIDHDCECSNNLPSSSCNTLKALTLCKNTYFIGGDVPNNSSFVASGKRFFVNILDVEEGGSSYPETFYYGAIRYWIWLK